MQLPGHSHFPIYMAEEKWGTRFLELRWKNVRDGVGGWVQSKRERETTKSKHYERSSQYVLKKSIACINSEESILLSYYSQICIWRPYWSNEYRTVGTIPKYHTVGTIPKYHTVGTIPKSNIKIVEETKSIPLQTITWPFNSLAWYRHFNRKWRCVASCMGPHLSWWNDVVMHVLSIS